MADSGVQELRHRKVASSSEPQEDTKTGSDSVDSFSASPTTSEPRTRKKKTSAIVW